MKGIENLIVKDLKKMNYTMSTKFIRKQYDKQTQTKTIIKNNKIKIVRFNKIKYKLPTIKLEGKYLHRYNDLLLENNIFLDLVESGYYLYDFKLKQHLSTCGINRTKQLYGTCWLDSLISSFVFSNSIKNRFLNLIEQFIKKMKIKNIKSFISKINKKQIKLSKTVDKNQKKIFVYLISILYSIFCDEGIRNNKNKHDNFILTNFAINIRNYNSKKKLNHLVKPENIAFNSYYALEHIFFIFNKFVDTSSHLLYYKTTNDYSFENLNHINSLFFTIGSNQTNINGGYGYYYDFKNIDIRMKDNDIDRKFKFNSGYNIRHIDNIDFLVFSVTHKKEKLRRHIPKNITCSVNNVKTRFKLESASISIEDSSAIGHALTGIICQGEYYIYDPNNNYFKIDWTNLTGNNIKQIINYYKIINSANNRSFINNQVYLTTNKNYIEHNIDIYIEYATYYNTSLDNIFTSKDMKCNPHRPVK